MTSRIFKLIKSSGLNIILIITFITPFINTCAESEISEYGTKRMDGTAVITKSFCEPPSLPKCQEWLNNTKKELGRQLIRATECHLVDNSDVAGCGYPAITQIIYRFSENLNLNPMSCIDQINKIVKSSDDLRNCLGEWAFRERGADHHKDRANHDDSQLKTFSPILKEIYGCVDGDWKTRNECIFDVAQKYKDSRLCYLNDDPYLKFQGSKDDTLYRKSQPNCFKKLGVSK